jgi:hypothetical protein
VALLAARGRRRDPVQGENERLVFSPQFERAALEPRAKVFLCLYCTNVALELYGHKNFKVSSSGGAEVCFAPRDRRYRLVMQKLFNYIDANSLINQLHAPLKVERETDTAAKTQFCEPVSVATLGRTFLPGSVEKFGS